MASIIFDRLSEHIQKKTKLGDSLSVSALIHPAVSTLPSLVSLWKGHVSHLIKRSLRFKVGRLS